MIHKDKKKTEVKPEVKADEPKAEANETKAESKEEKSTSKEQNYLISLHFFFKYIIIIENIFRR